MDQNRLDTLNRQASMAFLEGDVEGATASWREILEDQPENENALDGLRMCEQWDREAVEIEEQPAVELEAPGVEDSVEDALSALDLKLDLGPPDPAETLTSAAAAGIGPIESQSDPTTPNDPSVPGAVPVFTWGAGQPDGATVDEVGEAVSESVGELRRRIADLIGETRKAMDEGQTDRAGSILDRVLILDDGNSEALALRDKLSDPGRSSGAEAGGFAEGVDLDLTEGELPELSVDDQSSSATSQSSGDGGGGHGSDDDPANDEPEGEQSEGEDAPPPPEAIGVRSWLRPPRVYLVAVLVLGLVGGLVGLRFLGGGAEPESLDPPVVAKVKKKKKPVAEAPPATLPVPTAAPAVLLQQAGQAMEAGNFAAAVVAYDKLLELESDNAEYTAGLETASELYREERAAKQKWLDIATAFETRNFRDALRILYRLPDEGRAAVVESNITSAWYNLGVEALRARECSQALDNFNEILALRPDDPGLGVAVLMAQDCGRSDPKAYRGKARRLEFREPQI